LRGVTIFLALVVCYALSIPASAKGTGRTENLYEPQHFESLPPEIRSAIAKICSAPRAMHVFAEYSEGANRITLHFERFYCQGRDVFCNASGCLHQVYILSNGHYRLEHSYYAPN
jgi:hypothetical protein